MKKLLFLLAFSATLFTSCLKDTCDEVNVYTMYEPVYKNLDEIRSVSADAPQELINPGQIYIYKNYLFINEFRKGIHIFDNSNPSKPINRAFYSIPGNAQLSIKDDLLYVNNFLDLLTINIADPLNIKVVDVEEFIFMDSYRDNFGMYDTAQAKLIVDYVPTKITEKVECGQNYYSYYYKNGAEIFIDVASSGVLNDAFGAPSNVGIGGSTAKFTIVGNALYTLKYSDLLTFDISAGLPVYSNTLKMKVNPETLFPFHENLLVGGANGMTIVNIDNPLAPVEKGSIQHIKSCDPVVASGNTAYVTLWNGSECGNGRNELQVIDISQLDNPVLLNAIPMNSPRGLSISDGRLIVCEESFGAKLFDVSDRTKAPLEIKSYPDIISQDVIWVGSNLIFIGSKGIIQYRMEGNELKLLSVIAVKQG